MDVDALKLKIIQDFSKFLCEVRKGYKPNYDFILEEISLVDILQNCDSDKTFLITLQYYLNNK